LTKRRAQCRNLTEPPYRLWSSQRPARVRQNCMTDFPLFESRDSPKTFTLVEDLTLSLASFLDKLAETQASGSLVIPLRDAAMARAVGAWGRCGKLYYIHLFKPCKPQCRLPFTRVSIFVRRGWCCLWQRLIMGCQIFAAGAEKGKKKFQAQPMTEDNYS